MLELRAKALKAAEEYCARRGYEILSTDWEDSEGRVVDAVVDDEGTICFVDVTVVERFEDGFSEDHLNRADWEIAAASWLSENAPDGEFEVRFDYCDMVVIAPSRALLRYYTDVLSRG